MQAEAGNLELCGEPEAAPDPLQPCQQTGPCGGSDVSRLSTAGLRIHASKEGRSRGPERQ